MNVAVMQPYLFPYIGYIELLNQADVFVVMDDVHYNKKSWVKKNRILSNGNIVDISLPILKASQNKKINELEFALTPKNMNTLIKSVQQSYSKSPNFEKTMALIENSLQFPDTSVHRFLMNQLKCLSIYIGIDVKFCMASEVNRHGDFESAEKRIIDVVKSLGGNRYINLPGGRHLYDSSSFIANDIDLSFIEPNLSSYPQINTKTFVPSLSVIDVMMNTNVKALLS